MALSREITLTIDNYNITLDKEIKIYEYDAINLCFTIQEYGIVMRDGKAHNRVMPVVALKAYMLIETPQGVDSVEATNIVRNKVIFSLGNKYSQFVGVGKMQIILRDLDGCRITLPEFNYEVKQSINTGWDIPDVLIDEKDFVVTDELGRPIETTKISEMDEVNEVTPQTYTVVINEDGNKKIKLDTMMESISEMIEFNVEEIDRRIDEMIEVYDDEEVEVEFPSLHNDVERIKGEINEISESLDNMAILKPNGIDDTNNILKVLNTQNRVKLLDGVYHIKNIELKDDWVIEGSSNTLVKLIGIEGQPCLYTINKTNVTIKNIIFDGNMKNIYGIGVISIFNSNYCRIENNKFDNIYRTKGGGSSAIDVEGSDNCIIKGNIISNSGYGITLGSRVTGDTKLINGVNVEVNKHCDNNIIEANYIDTTTMDGIFLSASLNTASQDCEIKNNIIRNNIVKDSDDLGIESSRSSNNCLIEGNIVIGSAGANIFVRGGNNNIVTNNKCSKAKGKTNSYYAGGIAVSQDFGKITSCTITNNECFDNIGEGICVGAVTEKSIKISHNKIYGNDFGINLGVNSKGCRIIYNEVYNNTRGINLQAGTSNVAHHIVKFNSIYNNTIGIMVNGERNNIQLNDITQNVTGVESNIATTCNFNTIKNNDISGNTNNLILGESGTRNIYINNDGVTSEPKILISNEGKGYINEVYIDSSTNELCWNKDGSIKKVKLS